MVGGRGVSAVVGSEDWSSVWGEMVDRHMRGGVGAVVGGGVKWGGRGRVWT